VVNALLNLSEVCTIILLSLVKLIVVQSTLSFDIA